MRYMMQAIWISVLCLLAVSQVQAQAQLSFEEYMRAVIEHHPQAQIADIRIDQGESLLRMARGGFDPKIAADIARKDFEGKRYYDLLDAGLKVPTWLGVTLGAGYTETEGVFLNPEATTPQNGLLHAGISVPIGRGLFIDERRAVLAQAKIGQGLVAAERQLLLNDLLLDAGLEYWNWFASYHALLVFEEARQLAIQRFDAVKLSAELGDKPYIDTLEASIQVQARTLQWQQATLDAQNAAARMSIYLWLEGTIPMEVSPDTRPLDLDQVMSQGPDASSLVNIDTLIAAHPMIAQSEFVIEQRAIDLRFKREMLKPQLDLKYNALSTPTGGFENTGFNRQDFTYGLAFSMPILLRKERGAQELAGLKLETERLKLSDKRQQLWLKARVALNDQGTTMDQVKLFERTVVDYNSLLNGERELFRAGESSLFLVNSRESSYVSAAVKLIQLQTKNQMARLKADFALSQMMD